METVDVSLWHKRFKGEAYDIREFIQPNTLMVKELAEKLKTPEACYRWVVEEINYPYRPNWPSWTMIFSDFHSLFRHPPRPKWSFNFMDYWKFPSETIRDKIGDCEDSSFLLASLLRSLGEESYAVLGYVVINEMRYGHAWVEWKKGNRWYLLESTYDSPPDSIPPTNDLYWKVYFPEIRFNEEKVEIIEKRRVEKLQYWRLKKLRKPKRLAEAVSGTVQGTIFRKLSKGFKTAGGRVRE
ncbi:MAG: transglutaminase-like domain-containing protein [Candidatus Hadarchaeales archaeon]